MRLKISLYLLICPLLGMANFGADKIKHDNWNGIPVVHLQDERFPTYALAIYFEEGSLKDHPSRSGETAAMFSLLTAGTKRYEQKEILDHLDFFGASYSASVTHEYSVYEVSGLLKDIIPTMKKICHLFKDASFPQNVVKKEINHAVAALENLVSDHSSLATRVFRQLSMEGTPYSFHVEGTTRSLKRIGGRSLKSKLDHFNNSVGKRVYIAGPREALDVKEVISKECDWKGVDSTAKSSSVEKKFPKGPRIYLVTVPDANQAQVRIGRYLNGREATSMEINSLMSDFMSGGLSSKMLRELRTKRGLIYSGGVRIAKQRDYGRSAIITYTRNNKVHELITVIRDIFKEAETGKTTEAEFRRVQGRLLGKYPFAFEENPRFLNQLLLYDHLQKDYKEFFRFRDTVRKLQLKDMTRGFREIFDWNKMTILVLGNKSLVGQLNKLGPVKVMDYKAFL